jgi:hypothetical protein
MALDKHDYSLAILFNSTLHSRVRQPARADSQSSSPRRLDAEEAPSASASLDKTKVPVLSSHVPAGRRASAASSC